MGTGGRIGAGICNGVCGAIDPRPRCAGAPGWSRLRLNWSLQENQHSTNLGLDYLVKSDRPREPDPLAAARCLLDQVATPPRIHSRGLASRWLAVLASVNLACESR